MESQNMALEILENDLVSEIATALCCLTLMIVIAVFSCKNGQQTKKDG